MLKFENHTISEILNEAYDYDTGKNKKNMNYLQFW